MTVIGREPARWNVPHPLSTGTLMSVVPANAYDDAVAEVVALTERLKRHVNHAPIVILDDGVYCGQCGGHVIEWGP